MDSTPVPLGLNGQALYDSLAANPKITAAHRALILQAARLTDRLDQLTEHTFALVVENSQGTRTINPLISEHRMISTALSQLLKSLGVDALPKDVSDQPTVADRIEEQRKKREQRDANKKASGA